MGGVVNSNAVRIHGYELASQNGVFIPSRCDFSGFSTNKAKKSHSGISMLNSASVSIRTSNFCKCIEITVSTQTKKLHDASCAVATYESACVCQDTEEKETTETEEEVNTDSFGQNLPTWGYRLVHSSLDVNSESVAEPSTSSRDSLLVNEITVQLLEESDGEELSKRILVLSRSNKVRTALELFNSMKCLDLPVNGYACNSLLSCLLRNKLHDYALEVFEFIKANEIATNHTYSLMLKAIASTHGCNSALKLFAAWEGSEEKDFDVVVYNTMISLCARESNWIAIQKIWASMKENGCHGTQVTYSILICTFVRCGQSELALDSYDEMIKNGLEPRDDAMNAVIGASTKVGKWSLALSLFQEMLKHQQKPNLVACNALINSLGKAGEIKLAFKVLDVVKSLGHTPDAYTWNALTSSLRRANQHELALQLFETVKREEKCQMNEHLFHTALMSCQKLKLWDRAVQLLWQMEVAGLLVSTATYNRVILTCDLARNPGAALQVYEHMIHKKCIPDMLTYKFLIRSSTGAALSGEVEILDVVQDASLRSAVIKSLCLRDKVELAKKLHTKMCDVGLLRDHGTRS
ncbi:hypothetical protein K2173_013985 [Erythroxylum novogranatense]|uniref:Pentatricopeptide repeat-containing protein n=1 Tax=Erythroxylum novogranatense TaxID=1862640 RepID=A0AAV8SD05_9ROSI|nr:hypothetical protein K2173_013985 [Erythroxylum novogranatense]